MGAEGGDLRVRKQCSALGVGQQRLLLVGLLSATVNALVACCVLSAISSATFAQGYDAVGAPETADASPKPVKFGIDKHGAIVFHKTENYLVKCDIYQPVADVPTQQLMPAVVMIHGGAWRTGSKFSMLRHARRLARVGYVVMAINYRLAPKYPWPAQIEDCRIALDWLNEHAGDYNVDPQRVGVYGYSAGAHLASMLATTNEKNDGIKIRAAVVGGTPAEFSWIEADSSALTYWLGASRSQAPGTYRDASPISFVTADDPPFFEFHGETDMIVPVESARLFHAALKKQGVSSKLVEVPSSGHFATFGKMDLMVDVIKFFDRHLKPVARAVEPSTR